MCSRYIYTSQFLKPFSLLKTIIQSFTTNINVNTATYNFFLLKKKKKNSGSKTWRVCPFQRRGELFHFLDTLTFSVRIYSRKQTNGNKRKRKIQAVFSCIQGTSYGKRAAHFRLQNCRSPWILQTSTAKFLNGKWWVRKRIAIQCGTCTKTTLHF